LTKNLLGHIINIKNKPTINARRETVFCHIYTSAEK